MGGAHLLAVRARNRDAGAPPFSRAGARGPQPYGFAASFNPSLDVSRSTPLGWVSAEHIGINQGPICLMIENHQSGQLWKLMQGQAYVRNGLRRAGFSGGWPSCPRLPAGALEPPVTDDHPGQQGDEADDEDPANRVPPPPRIGGIVGILRFRLVPIIAHRAILSDDFIDAQTCREKPPHQFDGDQSWGFP